MFSFARYGSALPASYFIALLVQILIMEGATPQKPTKEERLATLAALKATSCYCSECGSELRFRSFKAHPCYKEAVRQHGKWKAGRLVYRLPSPAPSHQSLTSTLLKRPRSSLLSADEHDVVRVVRPRLEEKEAQGAVLLEDLAAFGMAFTQFRTFLCW